MGNKPKRDDAGWGVYAENVEKWNLLRKAYKGKAYAILKHVASFPDKKGCFESNETLIAKVGGMQERTFIAHEKYLEHTGGMVITRTMGVGRDGRPKMIKVRRLGSPSEQPLASQAEFNRTLKMNAQQEKLKAQEEKMVFRPRDFRGEPPAIFAEEPPAKIAPQVVTVSSVVTKLVTTCSPPFANDGAEVERQAAPVMMVGQTADRPWRDDCRQQEFSSSKEKTNDDNDWSEPLVDARRQKTPRTQKERRLASHEKLGKGHIANPLGNANNKLVRLHRWKAGSKIAPEGNVTRSQLWNHLIDLYDDAFGEGIGQGMLAEDRTGFDAFADAIRQNFIDICSHDASNRDLADYFAWVFTVKMPAITKNDKFARDASAMHVNALKGKNFAREFFSAVLRRKIGEKRPVSPEISRIHERTDFIRDAFDDFAKSAESDLDTAFEVSAYGYVLYAQYLHEKFGLTESECKKRIIEVLVRFLGGAAEPSARESAMRIIASATRATEKNKALYDDIPVFANWKEMCPDIVSVAIEQAGEKT